MQNHQNQISEHMGHATDVTIRLEMQKSRKNDFNRNPVLLILGLCFLWLKCKSKSLNSASCPTCPHGPLSQLPPPRPPSLAIKMMELSTSTLQPLSNPRGRTKDEEEIITEFLQFSKSKAQASPTAPETNPYMLRQGCHPVRKVQFFLTLFKRPLTPPPLLFEHLSYFAGGVF